LGNVFVGYIDRMYETCTPHEARAIYKKALKKRSKIVYITETSWCSLPTNIIQVYVFVGFCCI